ncbi:carboxypeptidase regulatory-like domain-containing protein [Candidatus Desantisbacteria bacterium]|nr:carboxypeptidase regulatory-like domain-containing protein [Candidatus Desantisbacteria bacterium]
MNRKISYTISVLILLILSLITTESQNIYAEVYGSISGRVLFAETGEPVKGILVSISVLDPETCTPLSCRISSTIKTDVNGNYVFNRIPPGEYKINLGDLTTEYNHYYYDTSMGRLASGYSDADCEKYKLFVGKKSVDDYVYRKVYESHNLPIKFLSGKNITELNILFKKVYGTISGKILREDNTPFEGSIRLSASTIIGDTIYYPRYFGDFTQKDGSFNLQLLQDSPGWNLFIYYRPNYEGNIAYAYKYPTLIDIKRGEDKNDIMIYPIFDTTTVFIATVYDTTKIPLKGIKVYLIHKNILGQKDYNIVATTNEYGKIFIKGLPSGIYNIELDKPIDIEKTFAGKKIVFKSSKKYIYQKAVEIILNKINEEELIFIEDKATTVEPTILHRTGCNSSAGDLANDLCNKICQEKKFAECGKNGPCPTQQSNPAANCGPYICDGITFCYEFGRDAGDAEILIKCDDPIFYEIVEAHEKVHKTQYSPCSKYDNAGEYNDAMSLNHCNDEKQAFTAEKGQAELYVSACRSTLNLGNDWCDEQFAVNDPVIPKPLYYSQLPDVAILEGGSNTAMQSLISTFRYSNILTDITTTSQELFSYAKVCVIPTGGLVGNDSSPQFKALLGQYVSAGGFLVVMATQHSSDLSCIPVTEGDMLSGYMWREDMSCWSNSVEIQEWHTILSGQSKNILSEPVDGYFTSWPKESKILLRRTKNGQPCMLLYSYGKGWVLATTIYTDYGYSVGQASTSGKALLRDIITWARNSVEMIEYRPGSSIDIPITITNKTEVSVNSVSVSVLTPNGVEKEKIPLNLPLQKGETGAYTYTGTAGQELGIWRIEYALLDSAGIKMQKESAGANFVVSSPPANIKPAPDLSFSVQSNTENYVKGSSAEFTIISWNTSDEERNITCKYFFPHHWWNTQNVQYV